MSAGLYGPFVALTDLHRPGLALAAVLGLYLLRFRRVLAAVDWALLAVFLLMFIDLRVLAGLPAVHALMQSLGLDTRRHLFLTGVVSAQLLSNVPAAILLAPYTHDWGLLAYAVNVGGFGWVLGSLANLIALRLARDPKGWLVFHLYSVPFLLVAGSLVYVWSGWA